MSVHHKNTAAIDTWFQDEAEEDGMREDHAYLWQHLIENIREKNLRAATVLDYGCNRGGFLQLLYNQSPYQRGIGVDVADASLAVARQRNKNLPLEFIQPQKMDTLASSVDIAFSHEVLYLLPDLEAHAASIYAALKPGASYYAVIGCHTDNPLWASWHELIAKSTNLPVYDYSLDDYATALRTAGFRVEMKAFQLEDYVLIKPENAYFPKAVDSLNYHMNVKTIIRASKEA
jgi:SAM-dependent methyltransferase